MTSEAKPMKPMPMGDDVVPLDEMLAALNNKIDSLTALLEHRIPKPNYLTVRDLDVWRAIRDKVSR